MSDKTKIEWADATWNPVTGCTRVSPGCENCYIDWAPPFRIEGRHFTEACPKCSGLGGLAAIAYAGKVEVSPPCPTCQGTGRVRSHAIGSTTGVRLHPERLDQPLRWKRPRKVFVNSLSDLFHVDVPDEYIARVWAVMALASQHTFQVLTKRHGRMRALLKSWDFRILVHDAVTELNGAERDEVWPPPNVWVGVTVEDQERADLRIPALLVTPAAVRFLSCEPLLGPVVISSALQTVRSDGQPCTGIDWVIAGGESGRDARPMHPDWARSLRDQCQATGVPFLFKQRGEWTWSEPGRFQLPTQPFTDRDAVMHPGGMVAMTKSNPFNPFERGHPNWTTRITRVGKKAAGRELDGRTWDEYPDAGDRGTEPHNTEGA